MSLPSNDDTLSLRDRIAIEIIQAIIIRDGSASSTMITTLNNCLDGTNSSGMSDALEKITHQCKIAYTIADVMRKVRIQDFNK